MTNATFGPALKQKSAYKFWVKDHVRFTDLDALGHVSAVRTNEFFNGVRAALFHRAIEKWPYAQQLPVLKWSVIQHEQESGFPDDLDVGLVIEAFGTTSVTAVMGVFNASGCIALSRNVFVFIDAETRLSTPPNEQIKQNLRAFAG